MDNQPRLAKRKRALLESNPPGIANWKLIETMRRGRQFTLPPSQRFSSIGSIDFLMPQKTHACGSLDLSNDRSFSNSAGERYPKAECKRFRL
jgi:hypothetical protein